MQLYDIMSLRRNLFQVVSDGSDCGISMKVEASELDLDEQSGETGKSECWTS